MAGYRVVVAWYDPPFVVVHGDAPVETEITVPGAGAATMIGNVGQTEAEATTHSPEEAGVTLTLDQTPAS